MVDTEGKRALRMLRRGVPVRVVSQLTGHSLSALYSAARRRDIEWKRLEETFVYALVCPFSEQFVYVGLARNPLTRFYQHLHGDPVSKLVGEWLQSLRELERVPDLRILEVCRLEHGADAEKRWIKKLARKHPLLNEDSAAHAWRLTQ